MKLTCGVLSSSLNVSGACESTTLTRPGPADNDRPEAVSDRVSCESVRRLFLVVQVSFAFSKA